MSRLDGPRQILSSFGLLVIAVGCLALARRWTYLAPQGAFPQPGVLSILLLSSAAAALHRPLGGSTLGLGTMVLPIALQRYGALPAAWLAGLALVAVELTHRWLQVHKSHAFLERRGAVRILETAAQHCLATFTSGLVWSMLFASSEIIRSVTSGVTYLGVSAVVETARHRIRRHEEPFQLSLLMPLSIDSLGWLGGVGLNAVLSRTGWGPTGLLLATLVLLSLEAARNAHYRQTLERKIHSLERLRGANQRVIKSSSELTTLADQIRWECASVIPVTWFHLEVLAGESEQQSWYAERQGELRSGYPRPGKSPPPLPGIHRRASWRRIERQLRLHGQTLGRLHLWCDPRRLDPQALQLFDMLLPQLAASVERCILDREAKLDPLTGVAVRRVLEGGLQEAYRRACNEGSPVAVVLFDLDRFKKINDTHGHAAGDEALVQIGRVLRESGRDTDLCCRYGGEEFAILLDGADGPTALAVAERVRKKTESCPFLYEAASIPLTVSAGVAAFPQLYVRSSSELLLLADQALYAAKGSGRNRCLLHLGNRRYQEASGRVLRA